MGKRIESLQKKFTGAKHNFSPQCQLVHWYRWIPKTTYLVEEACMYYKGPALQKIIMVFFWVRISFLLGLNNIPLYVYTYILVFHSSAHGHFGCVYLLIIMSNGAMKINMLINFFLRSCFKFFGYVPRIGIARSYGNSIFNFLGNHHTVFCGRCTFLHPL